MCFIGVKRSAKSRDREVAKCLACRDPVNKKNHINAARAKAAASVTDSDRARKGGVHAVRSRLLVGGDGKGGVPPGKSKRLHWCGFARPAKARVIHDAIDDMSQTRFDLGLVLIETARKRFKRKRNSRKAISEFFVEATEKLQGRHIVETVPNLKQHYHTFTKSSCFKDLRKGRTMWHQAMHYERNSVDRSKVLMRIVTGTWSRHPLTESAVVKNYVTIDEHGWLTTHDHALEVPPTAEGSTVQVKPLKGTLWIYKTWRRSAERRVSSDLFLLFDKIFCHFPAH